MSNRTGKRKAGKIIAIICLVAAAAAIVITGLISNYIVDFALKRKDVVESDIAPESVTSDESQKIIESNIEKITEEVNDWLKTVKREEVKITSDDGLALVGDAFYTQEPSKKWAILLHGYTNTRDIMYGGAMMYINNGYNVLTPDLRGHGDSEGQYIGMGWLDRLDVLKWIDLIIQKDKEAEIVLNGVSMGGATVMMTVGETLPANVKAAVEDCGYTSVWDIFSDEAKYLFHIPDFPIVYTASALANAKVGYSFKQASSLRQIVKAKIPVLFIHGSEDNFVRTDMVYDVYNACPTHKSLYIAEGAGHGMSFYLDPERYEKEVMNFIENVR